MLLLRRMLVIRLLLMAMLLLELLLLLLLLYKWKETPLLCEHLLILPIMLILRKAMLLQRLRARLSPLLRHRAAKQRRVRQARVAQELAVAGGRRRVGAPECRSSSIVVQKFHCSELEERAVQVVFVAGERPVRIGDC